MSDDASFLHRWSRLKRRMTLERQAPAKAPAVPETVPVAAPPPRDEPSVATTSTAVSEGKPADEETVDVSKLPPIESLGKDSDYSIFMRKGVPDDLRMKALRRLWMTDPVLAGPEVLDMYAFDYTGVDGHKPLARPVVEVLAATAKAVKEAVTETAKRSEAHDRPDGPSATTAPQHDDAAVENRSNDPESKPS